MIQGRATKGGDMMYTDALKTSRKAARMTQEEVAEALNVSQAIICKWERGDGTAPSISRLIQLADLYKVSVDELIGRKQA